MLRRKVSGAVDLPKGVHRLTVRGRIYFYWHPGRGTPSAQKPKRLPDDPTTPDFWVRLREYQGLYAPGTGSIGSALDLYLTSPQFLSLAQGSRELYGRSLEVARRAWGTLPVTGIRPVHVRAMMDQMSSTPSKANNFLIALRTFGTWCRVRDIMQTSICEGVKPFQIGGGHKPWTDEQIAAAKERLTGGVRRAVILALYTGQRGSDLVRLGPESLDENGFRLTQRKTGREVWCPIVPELAAEMDTWERERGPYVRGRNGRPIARPALDLNFREQVKHIPELQGVTLHGLRATAVVRLRRLGLSTAQIQDIVGLSLQMIERYSRFADKKASGKAALKNLDRESRK